MLRFLNVENFKAFAGRQSIPFGRLTLIYGANSAGKSSIFHSLLLLKQTAAQVDPSGGVLLPKGELVDLGSYREFIYQHKTELDCEIAPIFDADRSELVSGRVRRGRRPRPKLPVAAGLGFRFRYPLGQRRISISSIACYVGDAVTPVYVFAPSEGQPEVSADQPEAEAKPFSRPALSGRSVQMELANLRVDDELMRDVYEAGQPQRARAGAKLVSLSRALASKSGQVTDRELIDAFVRSRGSYTVFAELRGMSRVLKSREQLADQLREAGRRLRSYSFESFNADLRAYNARATFRFSHFLPTDYTLSSRDTPAASFRLREGFETERSTEGLDLPSRLTALAAVTASGLDSLVYVGPLREFPARYYIFSGNIPEMVGRTGGQLPDLLFGREELVQRANEYLDAFETGYELRVRHVQEKGVEDVFALQLVERSTGTEVTIQDVGFGISQVLPIVVQSLLTVSKSLLIEQPEIHLHPRLQANLGTLFHDCISNDPRNQVIVETHSEHIMLRIQKLVRDKRLDPAEVSVIYVTRDGASSSCHHLRLGSDGDFIDEWPEGFFEEGYNEIFGAREGSS